MLSCKIKVSESLPTCSPHESTIPLEDFQIHQTCKVVIRGANNTAEMTQDSHILSEVISPPPERTILSLTQEDCRQMLQRAARVPESEKTSLLRGEAVQSLNRHLNLDIRPREVYFHGYPHKDARRKRVYYWKIAAQTRREELTAEQKYVLRLTIDIPKRQISLWTDLETDTITKLIRDNILIPDGNPNLLMTSPATAHNTHMTEMSEPAIMLWDPNNTGSGDIVREELDKYFRFPSECPFSSSSPAPVLGFQTNNVEGFPTQYRLEPPTPSFIASETGRFLPNRQSWSREPEPFQQLHAHPVPSTSLGKSPTPMTAPSPMSQRSNTIHPTDPGSSNHPILIQDETARRSAFAESGLMNGIIQKAVETAVAAMNSMIDVQNKELAEKDAQIESLQVFADTSSKAVARVNCLEDQNSELQAQLDEKRKLCTNLEQQMTLLQTHNENLTRELQSIQNSSTVIQKQNFESEHENKQLKKENGFLRTTLRVAGGMSKAPDVYS